MVSEVGAPESYLIVGLQRANEKAAQMLNPLRLSSDIEEVCVFCCSGTLAVAEQLPMIGR